MHKLGIGILSFFIATLHFIPQAGANPEDLLKLLLLARKQELAKNYGQAKAEEAEAKVKEADSRLWPDLNITSGLAPIPKATLVESPLSYSTDKSDWSVFWRIRGELRQGITSFGRLSAYQNAAKKGLEAAELAVPVALAEQDLVVRKLYFGFLIANDSEAYLADKIGILEKEVQSAEKKHNAQPGNRTKKEDFLKLKAFFLKYKALLSELRAMKASGVHALHLLTGMPEKDVEELDYDVEPEPVNESLSFADAEARLDTSNLDLQIAKKRAQAKGFLVEAKKKEILPLLGIFAFGEYNVAPNRTRARNPYLIDRFNGRALGVAIGLTWDFNYFTWDARVSEARAQQITAQSEFEVLRLQKRMELKNTFETWRAAVEAQTLQADRFLQLKRITTVKSLGNSLGVTSAKDIMDAFKDQIDARKDWLEAVYEQNLKGAVLARMIGANHVYPESSLKDLP